MASTKRKKEHAVVQELISGDPPTAGAEAEAGSNGRLPLFLIRNRDHVHLLRVEDIDWVQADGNYTSIRAGKSEYLVRRGIGEMEARLDRRFLRISRSAIVNLARIERLIPWFSGGYRVRLTTGVEFKLTNRYAQKLFDLVGRPL